MVSDTYLCVWLGDGSTICAAVTRENLWALGRAFDGEDVPRTVELLLREGPVVTVRADYVVGWFRSTRETRVRGSELQQEAREEERGWKKKFGWEPDE